MCSSPPQIIVLGPPGAGKGTQAARIAKRLGAIRVSTGELLREWTHTDPVGSREIAATLAAGELVPDEVVDPLVRELLETLPAEQGFILDGYPRSPAQAERLRSVLAELGRLDRRPLLVWLEAPRDELLRRLRRRAQLEGRADDTETAMERRLDLHDAQASTVRAALDRWTDTRRVDGARPACAVTQEILDSLCARTAPARPQPPVAASGRRGSRASAA